MRCVVCVILAGVFAAPLEAQSSLGIRGSDLTFGFQQDEAGRTQMDSAFRVDVAITEYHGFQGDVAFADTENGLIGTIAAHLYMTPKPGQRYGLFASLSDIDGRTMSWGDIGAEGMVSVGENAVIEGRLGMGLSDVDGLDYVFAGGAWAQEITPSIEIGTSLDLVEIDEADFSAIGYDFGVNATSAQKAHLGASTRMSLTAVFPGGTKHPAKPALVWAST